MTFLGQTYEKNPIMFFVTFLQVQINFQRKFKNSIAVEYSFGQSTKKIPHYFFKIITSAHRIYISKGTNETGLKYQRSSKYENYFWDKTTIEKTYIIVY